MQKTMNIFDAEKASFENSNIAKSTKPSTIAHMPRIQMARLACIPYTLFSTERVCTCAAEGDCRGIHRVRAAKAREHVAIKLGITADAALPRGEMALPKP